MRGEDFNLSKIIFDKLLIHPIQSSFLNLQVLFFEIVLNLVFREQKSDSTKNKELLIDEGKD